MRLMGLRGMIVMVLGLIMLVRGMERWKLIWLVGIVGMGVRLEGAVGVSL